MALTNTPTTRDLVYLARALSNEAAPLLIVAGMAESVAEGIAVGTEDGAGFFAFAGVEVDVVVTCRDKGVGSVFVGFWGCRVGGYVSGKMRVRMMARMGFCVGECAMGEDHGVVEVHTHLVNR